MTADSACMHCGRTVKLGRAHTCPDGREPFAVIEHEPMTDAEVQAQLDAVTPAEWEALEDDLRDLEMHDPHVAAAARSYEEMQASIIGEPVGLQAALEAADITELVRARSTALAQHKYGAVERIGTEIDRRHQLAAREQWSTPRPGQKPVRRKP